MTRIIHRALFATVTSLLMFSFAAQAQQPQDQNGGQQQSQDQRGRPGAIQRQRQHMAMLAQKLNLTDEQKQQFQQIGRNLGKQGMAIRQDSALTDDQKREKIQELRKQAHLQMFAILTPEQKEQLKQMREQHKKEQEKAKAPGDQASKKTAADDEDPFAGMTSDDDDGPGNGGF
jgi:Spy/CpxP family protein refolding chaperone